MEEIIKKCERGGFCKRIRDIIQHIERCGFTVKKLEINRYYKGLVSEVSVYTNAPECVTGLGFEWINYVRV